LANENLVVGLDIGTTKICVVIGERNEKGVLEITGVGVSPSTGMRKGVVINIEATLKSIIEAVEAAEMMSGREVHTCWTGIGGSHIHRCREGRPMAVKRRQRRFYH
jgi:cell division protein FtsA